MTSIKTYVPWLKCAECGESERIFQEGMEVYCGHCGLILHDLSILRPTLNDMEHQTQLQLEEDKEYYRKLLTSFHAKG